MLSLLGPSRNDAFDTHLSSKLADMTRTSARLNAANDGFAGQLITKGCGAVNENPENITAPKFCRRTFFLIS